MHKQGAFVHSLSFVNEAMQKNYHIFEQVEFGKFKRVSCIYLTCVVM